MNQESNKQRASKLLLVLSVLQLSVSGALLTAPLGSIIHKLFSILNVLIVALALFTIAKKITWLSIAIWLIALWLGGLRAMASEHLRVQSQDGNYVIIAYSVPAFYGSIGGASDASGYAQVRNARGQILSEIPITAVRQVELASWGKDDVRIGNNIVSLWP